MKSINQIREQHPIATRAGVALTSLLLIGSLDAGLTGCGNNAPEQCFGTALTYGESPQSALLNKIEDTLPADKVNHLHGLRDTARVIQSELVLQHQRAHDGYLQPTPGDRMEICIVGNTIKPAEHDAAEIDRLIPAPGR